MMNILSNMRSKFVATNAILTAVLSVLTGFKMSRLFLRVFSDQIERGFRQVIDNKIRAKVKKE